METKTVSREYEEARNKMWASLISGYSQMTRSERNKAKKEFAMQHGFKTLGEVSFDTLEKVSALDVPKKGNENMYVEQNMTVKEVTTEDTRRTYFLRRIEEIFCSKRSDLEKKYGMYYESPKNPRELVEWIKEGKFDFSKRFLDDEEIWSIYNCPLEGIRWTKVKEDRKGFETAMDALRKERTSYVDEIWAELDAGKFPEIITKFEKSKSH